MRTVTTANFTSPIWDTANIRAAGSKAVMDSARQERDAVKQDYQKPKSGRLYAKKRGGNFRRFHRASARGESPAVDTGNQLNKTVAERTGELSSEVRVDTAYAPFLANRDRLFMDQKRSQEALDTNYAREIAKIL